MVQSTQFQRARELQLSETTDASEQCPICHCREARRAVAQLQTNPAIPLLECPRCGGCSASRMPLPEVLASYYSDYYQGHSPHDVTLHDVIGFADHIRGFLRLPAQTGPLRILDYGGGDGSLSVALAELLDRPTSITVVDYAQPKSPTRPTMAIEGRPDLRGVSGPFDIVIASAVFEHVPDLRPVLLQVFDLVGPQGHLYARTPYMVPLSQLIPSLDFTYPGHVHDLGPAFWNGIADTFGLDFDTVTSGPSRVETGFFQSPIRTAAAHALKLPARIEVALRHNPRHLFWGLVGGWEIVLRRRSSDGASAGIGASSTATSTP